ncbi:heat shock protein 70 [Thecamonas trahens ATCC 50062]|uniref:Heat shock protein 70 n=1 Tax=Thecamonas trahens ATCC 50062 TaxID=461836 RepID=A0A0L0DID2_THETB|nr:heat shock protein 70 [Thecamonas trahens ATCC 50062]KNC51866.1 heat shock protein 70 [Thecamonas trahens ATCC 50062]|eukprot:XP_013755727.1 heat shock protein 70 [Thecamonas trahens ATCC 50062]
MAASSETTATAIGIDLGTTYSCVGVWENSGVSIIPNRMGNRTTPSWVAYRNSERLVGEAAKRQAGRNPKNTLYDAKRLIGRKFDEESIQANLAIWPFKVSGSDAGTPQYEVSFNGETLKIPPEEVSSAVLMNMKAVAEDYLGRPVTQAVITVPAYFNDAQRQATKDAAEIAGLSVQRIINEPTAAALAYGLEKISDDAARNLLIFDLGGGTLDVTVLTVDNGVFEVRSTCGDSQLGGQDFDNALVDHFVELYAAENGVDLRTNAKSMMKLKSKCQEAKHSLAVSLMATIEIDSLYDGEDFDANITRAKFNELVQPLLDRCLAPVTSALADAGLAPEEMDEVILIGGSTRITEVQSMLENYFGGKQLNKRINPDEAVAAGAAIQAANLSLSTEAKAGTKLSGLTLLDVTPLSLGIELHNGKMSVIIPRNTSIPYRHTKTYYNNEDNQEEAIIEVFEGESALAASNRLLGKFTVFPLPPRPRGKLKINVTFIIDANGILEVEAVVKEGDVEISESVKIDQYKGLLSDDSKAELSATARDFEEAERAKVARQAAMDALQAYVSELERELNKVDDSVGNKSDFALMLSEASAWIASNVGGDGGVDEVVEAKERLERAWALLVGSEA